MPTYQVVFEAEKLSSVRNFFAPTMSKCIDKVLRSEKGEWLGEIIAIELEKVSN